MRTFLDRRVLLLVLFFVLIAVTATIGQRLTIQSESALTCVIEDTRTGGGSGVHAWAEQMGHATLALRVPLDEIRQELPSNGNCVITAGNSHWKSTDEDAADTGWDHLISWIRSGNTLIVVTSHWDSTPNAILDYVLPGISRSKKKSDDNDHYKSWDEYQLEVTESKKWIPAKTWWGGEMSVKANSKRRALTAESTQYASADDGPALIGQSLGQGMIYLLLDGSAWSNEGFDKADNAASLGRLLKEQLSSSGVLAFDEYRHGQGRIESFATLLMRLPGSTGFARMALLLGLLWLWANTRRFAPADEYREVERRTAMEYIDSVAAMNQRARAAPLTLKAIIQRLGYLMKRRGMPNTSLSNAIEKAQQTIERGERPAKPKNEIVIATELIQLRNDIYGTRRDSRTN